MSDLPVDGDVGGSPADTGTEESFDRGALETKLQDMMDGGNDGLMDSADDSGEDDVVLAELDDSQGEETAAQEDNQQVESEGEGTEVLESENVATPETNQEAAGEPSSTLPDSYRRSLAAHGWTPEQVEDGLLAGGHKFIEMSANIHAQRTAETAQWAEVGRKNTEVQTNVQDIPGSVPQALPPIDAKKLAEKHGDDTGLLEEIVGPINSTINAINSIIPTLQQGVDTVKQSQVDVLNTQVHKFFDGELLNQYREFYGGADQELTQEQMNNRGNVLDTASMILAGAQTMHRNLTMDQALIAAHDSTSSTFREQAVRATIQKAATKRSKGITQKPSKATQRPNTGPSKTPEERERKTALLLVKAFGK